MGTKRQNVLENVSTPKLKSQARAQPPLHFGGWWNFHEISFDDVIVVIQPWYNFFANGHRLSSLRNISENENFSLLIEMQTER